MAELANAWPTKRFFLDMLTRDIGLEDAILDLLDNSIDSLARSRKVPLTEALLDPKVVERHSARIREDGGLPKIDIQITQTKFSISDNCGGIDYGDAKSEIFRFGRIAETTRSRLSVYGIGLKRAIFKIGRSITIRSNTPENGFQVFIDTEDWATSDQNKIPNLEDWTFPIKEQPASRSPNSAGTDIEITKLNDAVKRRISDGEFEGKLHSVIATAYALLLDHFVVLRVNGARVRPNQIPLGLSPKVTPGREQFSSGDVTITVVTGLAERVEDEWKIENAGWYVLCNGRVVVFGDRSDLTGWGVGLPQFVSKYRGFVGIVFFFSEHPESLPWTTTKRGLNKETSAYQLARNKMALLARPVLSFLNNMYPGGKDEEEPEERRIADTMKKADIAEVIKSSSRTFLVERPTARARSSFTSIQYKVPASDLEMVRKTIKKPLWSASKIGQHTFEYFMEKECGK